jgi:hypothetical protein
MAGWKTLRTDRFRYVVESDGNEMLFDLAADPSAYTDVSALASYTTALGEVRRELLRRLLERERPLPRAWPY